MEQQTSFRDAVLQQALELAPEDRAFVAEELERSLMPSPFASAEAEAAWFQELDRRIAAYDRGETTAISVEESLREARLALLDYRAKRAKP